MNTEFVKEALVRTIAVTIEDILEEGASSKTLFTSDLEEFDGLGLVESVRLIEEAIRDYREYHKLNMENVNYSIEIKNTNNGSLKLDFYAGVY